VTPFVKVKSSVTHGPEADLDVDVTGFLNALHRASIDLIGQGSQENLELAKTYLESILTIGPEQRPLLCCALYNMACVESLLGNLDSAIQFLNCAVDAGYTDVKHIRTDPDLENIRGVDGYKSILVKLLKLCLTQEVCKKEEGSVKQDAPVAVEVPKQEEVKEEVKEEEVKEVVQPKDVQVPLPLKEVKVAPQPVTTVVCAYPEQLKAMMEMGFGEVKSAEMLHRLEGDLSRAIEEMFN